MSDPNAPLPTVAIGQHAISLGEALARLRSSGNWFWWIAALSLINTLAPLMDEVRQIMGDGPVYLSFDIDGIDPAWAPGTGTPEVGGLTSIQGLEIVRGCRGLNLVGCDLVEVSPAYDTSGNTALLGANLLFEMLCVLPGVAYR